MGSLVWLGWELTCIKIWAVTGLTKSTQMLAYLTAVILHSFLTCFQTFLKSWIFKTESIISELLECISFGQICEEVFMTLTICELWIDTTQECGQPSSLCVKANNNLSSHAWTCFDSERAGWGGAIHKLVCCLFGFVRKRDRKEGLSRSVRCAQLFNGKRSLSF